MRDALEDCAARCGVTIPEVTRSMFRQCGFSETLFGGFAGFGEAKRAALIGTPSTGGAVPPDFDGDDTTPAGISPPTIINLHPRKIVIIPDAHAHPNYDNRRFTALGKFIEREEPDAVLCIGDFADMPSLSHYDKGKAGYEGRRYQADCDVAEDAQNKLMWFTDTEWIMCLGNHEERILRAANDSPGLEGKLQISDLGYDEFGWKVVPFREPVELSGISFCHYFPTGISGRPISGEHIASTMCRKLYQSAVQGHSHIYNHAERTKADGSKIFGLSVGCYVHPDYIENWNRDTARMWWRGVVVLDDCDGRGYYGEIRSITMRKLMAGYM